MPRRLPMPSWRLLLICLVLFGAGLVLIFASTQSVSVEPPAIVEDPVGAASFPFDAAVLARARAQTRLKDTKTNDLLTIVGDLARGDDQCTAFIHELLPDWVRWRYVSVRDDDIEALQLDTPALVVTRWMSYPSRIIDWAVRHPYPVGLMLMADETNVQHDAVYSAFDYVLRHYYFPNHPPLTIHALGNMTCAGASTDPRTWADGAAGLGPRLGIHWIMLQARGLGQLDSHHRPGSYWPASRRRVPAIWIGSLRADRERMLEVMRTTFPSADIQVEQEFGGSVGPYHYFHERMSRAVFALVPSGNNPETHRLAEAMDQGCIPVFLEADFQTAMFEPVPGVRARSWPEAARMMQDLLNGDGARLDQLQRDVVRWWNKWKQCVSGDLHLILQATKTLS